MNLLTAIRSQRDDSFTLDDYAKMVSEWSLGIGYPPFQQTMAGQTSEQIPNDFAGYVRHAYKANGVVFACQLSRLMLFSQTRFAYRRRNRTNGRPGDLFHTSGLSLLDEPWPGGTTGDLAARMIQDADFAGNNYLTVIGGQIHRLRPDHTYIVLGSQQEPDHPDVAMDARIIGYMYDPPRGKLRALLPEQVAHFAPIPDPEAHFRGMSWLTPVLREVRSDGAATSHKLKFFSSGATPNMIVKFDPTVSKEKAQAFKEFLEVEHSGAWNAYKTMYLGGGADATVVGADFKQMDFRATQGAGETRIAAASGIHPVIVGLSEGMQGSSLNQGNFSAARRLTADRTLRYLMGNAATSLSRLVSVPRDAELWYDVRDVPFFQEDEKDHAEIQANQAQTIRTLTDAGYTPESVIDAVTNGDMTLLDHSGLYSVQLQAAGAPTGPETNGDAGRALAALTSGGTHDR